MEAHHQAQMAAPIVADPLGCGASLDHSQQLSLPITSCWCWQRKSSFTSKLGRSIISHSRVSNDCLVIV